MTFTSRVRGDPMGRKLHPGLLLMFVLCGGGALVCAFAVRADLPTAKDAKHCAPPPFCGIGIAFVANGSGGDADLTEGLNEALRGARLPFAVDTTVWTLGLGAARDHVATERHVDAGALMAGKVACFRKAYPDRIVILIGHSAGTDVILRAAECLPENTVHRIILLAPSVSSCYDLRAALRSSRSGIDSYWSTEDGVLALAEDMLGTADGQHGPTAGR